jgi:hypothetical protein
MIGDDYHQQRYMIRMQTERHSGQIQMNNVSNTRDLLRIQMLKGVPDEKGGRIC